MPEELMLLPCPACGTPPIMTGGVSWHEQQEFWIKCNNKECGCCRVGDTVRENCIERWNALPRALTWTTEPPKVPGLYYQRWNWDGHWGDADVITVEQRSVDKIRKNADRQWAGPIPMPKEPS